MYTWLSVLWDMKNRVRFGNPHGKWNALLEQQTLSLYPYCLSHDIISLTTELLPENRAHLIFQVRSEVQRTKLPQVFASKGSNMNLLNKNPYFTFQSKVSPPRV